MSSANLSTEEASVVETLLGSVVQISVGPPKKKKRTAELLNNDASSPTNNNASPRSHAAAAAMRALGNIDMLASLNSASEMVALNRGNGSTTTKAYSKIKQMKQLQQTTTFVHTLQKSTTKVSVKKKQANQSEPFPYNSNNNTTKNTTKNNNNSLSIPTTTTTSSVSKIAKRNMNPDELEQERQQVLEKNRAAAKAYRKRKRDKEATLRERVLELEQHCKLYKQTLLQNGIADPVLQTSHF